MKKLNFTKMVASGNDFIVIDSRRKSLAGLSRLARRLCARKLGIGADGLLVLEKSKNADVRMRIFNADGSQAEMCGNGARCTARFMNRPALKIETKAGIIEARVYKKNVKIKLTDPKDLKLDLAVKLKRRLKVNFINTGVPHAVVFVEGLDNLDIAGLGRQLRYHKKFAPEGTNADFVEILSDNCLKLRTYERGVEEETLACGTGSVAAALIASLKLSCASNHRMRVLTRSGEVLEVYFDKQGMNFRNVWLKGRCSVVFNGKFSV